MAGSILKYLTSKYTVVLLLIFVAFGDKFLPAPVGPISYKVRSSASDFLKGKFPYISPVDNPHQRTEGAIDKLEGN